MSTYIDRHLLYRPKPGTRRITCQNCMLSHGLKCAPPLSEYAALAVTHKFMGSNFAMEYGFSSLCFLIHYEPDGEHQ